MRIARRNLLGLATGLALGRSRLAIADVVSPAVEARLVVVLLRGALDGLSAVPPYGDPDYARHRGELALAEPGQEGGALDLGGRFGLHPRLANLHRMYSAGDALVAHAVAGPWRSRSHFEAQDLLESGAAERLRSGWLNRALAGLPVEPAGSSRRALAVGVEVPLLLRGAASVASYSPAGGTRLDASLWANLLALTGDDAVLGPALREGVLARGYSAAVMAGAAQPSGNSSAFPALAAAAGRLLAQPNGPRVAALELLGWDTHAFQTARLLGPLGSLDDGLGALQAQLGDAWQHTAVLVMTEFGRTVRINGTRGTDHGTGGCAFLVGGAVAGGRVLADWPGLAEDRLLEGRDLMPTQDLRAIALGLLRTHLRLPDDALARAFPESASLTPQAGLLRG